MTEDQDKTKSTCPEFDFSAYPPNTLLHERRRGRERRAPSGRCGTSGGDAHGPDHPRPERRVRKDRRKRIDPTTFEKQYTEDELEFMNAMQRFKERTGKPFPTHGEVIKVAVSLGYRKLIEDDQPLTPGREPNSREIEFAGKRDQSRPDGPRSTEA